MLDCSIQEEFGYQTVMGPRLLGMHDRTYCYVPVCSKSAVEKCTFCRAVYHRDGSTTQISHRAERSLSTFCVLTTQVDVIVETGPEGDDSLYLAYVR